MTSSWSKGPLFAPPSEGRRAAPEAWTRAESIGRLRRTLLALCGGGDRSMCQVAADQGIFCRGFRRWPEPEFHERWKTFIGVSTHLTRPQMEELANIWQLCEQVRQGATLVCDAQTVAPGACRGWGEFSNRDLERFCGEMLGRDVTVIEERIEPLEELSDRVRTTKLLTSTPYRRITSPKQSGRKKNELKARRTRS